MYLEPKKIVFNSILKKVPFNIIKPHQENLNEKLITQLKKKIKEEGLLCPLVINTNNKLLDGHHRYEAIKDYCTEIDVYVVKTKYMEKYLSTLNSYLWFDTLEKLKDYWYTNSRNYESSV